jgi:outer membrane immunogenic protein
VFGLEGDMSWTNKKGQANDIAPFNTTAISATSEHWLATGRARLGFALSSPVLLYVTGGFAVASVEAILTPAAFPAVSESQTRWGWTAGAGAEWGFAPNWSAKLEYLRVELQSGGYFPAGGVVVAPGQTVVHRDNVPLNNNIVRAGINYRF